MRPELRRVGRHESPVVVVDGVTGTVGDIVALAARLAPFPAAAGTYYPGLRRFISPADELADAYVRQLCEAVAPFIAGAFDVDEFDLVEASFSMVTTAPTALAPAQRAPHFDSTDPRYFALLHYLGVPDASGTAFYRQRSTGIELVTEQNMATFIRTAECEAAQSAEAGYITGSNSHYEQIGEVAAVADRLIIYQGSLLHSGIIPAGMDFSSDPRRGRLTINLFVRAR